MSLIPCSRNSRGGRPAPTITRCPWHPSPQTAAESVGANGLLVRVGAYFHDIGKMLKPQYFVENQEQGVSRHDTLLPAMSTLIIIAHVKDGADLARQHHLPQPIVDFIQQHHGTTLVEYFYDRAHKQREGNPDAANIDEQNFRYPGPTSTDQGSRRLDAGRLYGERGPLPVRPHSFANRRSGE